MDYCFYKHTLKYTHVLHELELFFTNGDIFITNNEDLTQEFITSPNYVTSSYCDYLLNERLSNELLEDKPMFVTDGHFNEDTQLCTTCCSDLPEFVNNVQSSKTRPFKKYPIFVVENYNNNDIDDMLELDPNKNYYSNSNKNYYSNSNKNYYSNSEKLCGDYEDSYNDSYEDSYNDSYEDSYNDSYNENEKLYGFTDDYEEYWDSIYNE